VPCARALVAEPALVLADGPTGFLDSGSFSAAPNRRRNRLVPNVRSVLTATLAFNAVSAIGGGIALATGILPVPMSLLRNTPFDSYLVPGLFLGLIIGGSSAVAIAARRRSATSLRLSAAAGLIMVGWIVGETILIEGFSALQGIYLATGVLVVALSGALTGLLHE
jgi:hypothetical protein